MFQLYQALDFLHPLPMAAAQQLQEMVTRLGPFPLSDERSAADLSASEHLCAALGQLGLAFTANVPLSGYQAAAVLQPRDSVTVAVVLVTKALDHLRNQHYRCAFFLCSLCITAVHGYTCMLRPYLLSQRHIIADHTMRSSSKWLPCCVAQKHQPAAIKQLTVMFAG